MDHTELGRLRRRRQVPQIVEQLPDLVDASTGQGDAPECDVRRASVARGLIDLLGVACFLVG